MFCDRPFLLWTCMGPFKKRFLHRIKKNEPKRVLQLEGASMTREALVKIERGKQHIQASQLRTIKRVLGTTYEELLERRSAPGPKA